VDDARFLPPGNHPQLIREWRLEHGFHAPQTHGEIVRCVLESLAVKCRSALEKLQRISGQSIDAIHIVGGGVKNTLLNQFIADVTGVPVVTGPVEATVLGNAAMQFIALGELENIAQARQVIADMGVTQTYQPQETARWRDVH
jgi:sugar (pentulose or hexulose) kinase